MPISQDHKITAAIKRELSKKLPERHGNWTLANGDTVTFQSSGHLSVIRNCEALVHGLPAEVIKYVRLRIAEDASLVPE